MRSFVYSVICASAIGYLFGVIFATRSVEMSDPVTTWRDVSTLTAWLGATFGLVFIPVGVVTWAIVNTVHRLLPRGLARLTRIWLLAWIVFGGAIAIPFVGYFLSAGVDIRSVSSATSVWDVAPIWLLRVSRWLGFSTLTAATLAFVASGVMERFFLRRDEPQGRLWSWRILGGFPWG